MAYSSPGSRNTICGVVSRGQDVNETVSSFKTMARSMLQLWRTGSGDHIFYRGGKTSYDDVHAHPRREGMGQVRFCGWQLKSDLPGELYSLVVCFSRLLILYGIVIKKDHIIMLPVYMVGHPRDVSIVVVTAYCFVGIEVVEASDDTAFL